MRSVPGTPRITGLNSSGRVREHPAAAASGASSPRASPVAGSSASASGLLSSRSQSSSSLSGASKPLPTMSHGVEVLRCGDVVVELLLLPLFSAAAGHEHAEPRPRRALRIGRSEISPDEQIALDREMEKEAEVAAQATSMPRFHGPAVPPQQQQAADLFQPRSPTPIQTNIVAGLRLQLPPAIKPKALNTLKEAAPSCYACSCGHHLPLPAVPREEASATQGVMQGPGTSQWLSMMTLES